MATYAGRGVGRRVVALSGAAVLAATACSGGGIGSSPGGAGAVMPTTTSGSGGGLAGGGAGGGAGGSSPGAQAACAGLAPSFGSAVDALVAAADCAVATTSPGGQVALGVASGALGVAVDLRSPTGAMLGTIQALQPVPAGSASRDVEPWFHATSAGYHGIVPDPAALPSRLFRAYDASGLELTTLGQLAISSAPDGKGASVLLAQERNRAWRPPLQPSPGPPIGPTLLEWVDAGGRVTRSVPVDGAPGIVLVNPETGHVVTISLGSAAAARWFDATGQPLTPWFQVGNVVGTSMHLLVDGTVVLSDGSWNLALRDGVPNTVAVPDWLAARPLTRLATIRGGRGYAVLPMDPSSADATRFEIVAASGESCGTFAVPAPGVTASVMKTPRRLDVGQDGTLLQQLDWNVTSGPRGVQCEFRWWPALLR